MFFTTLQERLKFLKDSMPGLMDKDCSATFKFLPPCWNALLRSKTAHVDGYRFLIFIGMFDKTDIQCSSEVGHEFT